MGVESDDNLLLPQDAVFVGYEGTSTQVGTSIFLHLYLLLPDPRSQPHTSMARYLPPELWERVLNLLEETWDEPSLEIEIDADGEAGDDDLRIVACKHRYSMLTTCALVCQAWLPCSRIHLYHWVYVSDASQIALLVRTITEQPWLGGLVRELEVAAEAQPAAYLPFAHGVLVHHLSNLKRLKLSNLDFWKSYPSRYHTFLARFSVQDLTLTECSIPVAHLFHLLWSLPALDTLSLLDDIQDELVPGVTEFELLKLEEMQARKRRTCQKLHSLTISVSFYSSDLPSPHLRTVCRLHTLTMNTSLPTARLVMMCGPFR